MPKRYKKKRAKRTMKRRMVRRRRRLSARKPDGAYKEKVTIQRDMMTNSSTVAWHGIQWLKQNESTGEPNYHTCYNTDNKQHQTMSAVFNYYRVYGLSIRYIPHHYGQSNSNQAAVYSGYYGTLPENDTTSTIPSDERQLRNSPFYTPFDPTKRFKRFIRIGKWLKKNNIGWVESDLSVEPYPVPAMLQSELVITGRGLNSGGTTAVSIGKLYIDYYIEYKGRKYL